MFESDYREEKIKNLKEVTEEATDKLLYDLEEIHYHYLYHLILKRCGSEGLVFVTNQSSKLADAWSKKLSKVELIKVTSDLIDEAIKYLRENDVVWALYCV